MRDDDSSGIGGYIGIACGIAVAIAFITVIFGSWYTVDQTERGVLLSNGAFLEVVQPGLHFKWPWVQSISKVDMQTHKWESPSNADGSGSMEAYSADQQPAHIRVSVTYHIAQDKVAETYSRFGGDVAAAVDRLVTPHVYERVKDVFGQYTAQRAITDRAKLNADSTAAIIESIAYDPIFIIESVQIEDITFSPDYIKSVEARMQAEVQVQQQQQMLAQEKIKADIAVTQANGRANSVVAEAKAAADATVLKGNAEATAIKAKADALASNSNLIALTVAEKWNGQLPATMVPGSSVPFLNLGAAK